MVNAILSHDTVPSLSTATPRFVFKLSSFPREFGYSQIFHIEITLQHRNHAYDKNPTMATTLPNTWHLRRVAETAAKSCLICHKPSSSVLITPNNKVIRPLRQLQFKPNQVGDLFHRT
jgi:hypothetical protein